MPEMRTDFQALVTAASGGNASATLQLRSLARIWKRVAHIASDDISSLVTSGKLL